MASKKQQSQKAEICWNIVNSALAGGLVLLGSFTDGNITFNGVMAAVIASLIVGITRFKEYWTTQEDEYKCSKIFQFLN